MIISWMGMMILILSKCQDAFALSLTDLMPELERRRLPVKGFFSDDAKTLQAAFDREHAVYLEAKKKEQLDSKIVELKAAEERKRQALVNQSIEEEKNEILGNSRITAWFRMMLDGSSPLHCRIDELSNVSARSLSKLLWSDTRLVAVDVSNLNLKDTSGAYLAHALRNNTSLRKLELGGNQFAYETCTKLAESLLANTNSSIRWLSLESNPLSFGDQECIVLFAKAIGANTSLISLSLWSCGLSCDWGRLLAEAITTGASKLVSLEVGYNNFDNLDVEAIASQLVRV
jgi:hypothetical protein